MDLPLRARLLVLGSVVRAGLLWTIPFVALATSPWPVFGGGGLPSFSWRVAVGALLFPLLAVALVCMWFPHARFGDWIVRRITRSGATPASRTVNLAEELNIATGSGERYGVLLVASPVPNVAAIPGRAHTTVAVTEGAEQRLPRDELQALMATQIVVATDQWVRLASSAQLLSSWRFPLLFGAGFLNPLLIPLAFLAFFGHRRGDTIRDMVADFAALRATRHPDALSRSLFHLRPAAAWGTKLRVGLPGFLVDQYWVLSTRSMTKTTVSTPGGSRAWDTSDEIAAEMTMRADRIVRGARGELGALFDLRSWKRAVRGLGTDAVSPAGFPLRLTPAEQTEVAQIGQALGQSTGLRIWQSPF